MSLTTGGELRQSEIRKTGEGVFDLVVIGGGIHGACVARLAAFNGIRVLLLEARDYGFGTSCRSSKLLHGGLRYLARGDVGVAMESARERGILLEHTAPHLTHALPNLLPLASYVDKGATRIYRAGILAGDLLRRAAGTSPATLPRPRRATTEETLGLAPALRPDSLTGGLVHYDGQLTDDARLVVALARTAAGLVPIGPRSHGGFPSSG